MIMIDTRALNLGWFTDPAHMIVEAAQPSNVEWVMVDGRVLKSRGALTAVDVAQVITDAGQANAGLRERVKL
jgi:cytosine/adenosine deaminase-related metal-dependent hydrolase